MTSPEASLGPGARRIIRVRAGVAEIVVDHWQLVRDGDPLPSFAALPVLVSPARLVGEREAIAARPGGFGLWVPGETEPEALIEYLDALAVLAIEVPKFTDGRHYSLARLIRERYGFGGELRAFGDVLPDQLFYMRRCGYDAFELKPGKSLETGLRTLSTFSVAYQAAADQGPLYRRRARF